MLTFFSLLLLAILRLRCVGGQVDRDSVSSPQQFLYFTSSSCTLAAQPRSSTSAPTDAAKLYYQALHEHMASASTSDYILVGARNLALNISLHPRLDVANMIVWFREEEQCEQLIRTYLPTSAKNDQWLICDASRQQECRRYSNGTFVEQTFAADTRLSNEGRSTAYFSADAKRLFFAGLAEGCAQFELASADNIEFDQRVAVVDYMDIDQREPGPRFFDSARFNFHSLQEQDDKMYLFFEEAANETQYQFKYQRYKRRVARVAEICKREQGFMPERELWPLTATFRKLRLSCRIGNTVYEAGIEYDSFVGSSRFGKLKVKETGEELQVFYAVFGYSNEYLRRAAVCMYDVKALQQLFEQHREHYDFDTSESSQVPRTVMASQSVSLSHCSASPSKETVQFVRKYPLLTATLNPIGWKPIFVTPPTADYSITSITVDWQVTSADGYLYNVLYLGTESGKVLRVAVDNESSYGVTEIAASNEPILSVHLGGASKVEQVIAVTNSSIISSSVARCSAFSTCETCVYSRDVYCAWTDGSCARSILGLNDVRNGNMSLCPNPNPKVQAIVYYNAASSGQAIPVAVNSPVMSQVVSANTTSTGIATSVLVVVTLVAVLVGLLVGYVLGKRSGLKPFTRLAGRVRFSLRNRVHYSPVITTLSGRLKQRLFGRPAATSRCDSTDQSKPVMDYSDDVPKLNNLSDSHEANLYATSTRPIINIYESMYENGPEDAVHADAEEDEAAHYADVIQSCSNSRASVAMMDETEENGGQGRAFFDKIVLGHGSTRMDGYSGLRAAYTASRSESTQTKSSSCTDSCVSPDVNDYDGCLQVPGGLVASKRPLARHVPRLFSAKLKGLLLDRFASTFSPTDSASVYATSSSNSSVL